jgi:hypothetical protein
VLAAHDDRTHGVVGAIGGRHDVRVLDLPCFGALRDRRLALADAPEFPDERP